MKYLIVLIIVLSLWTLVDQFFSKDRLSGGSGTFFDELKDLGHNIHVMMGIIAILIIILFVVRLVYKGVESP